MTKAQQAAVRNYLISLRDPSALRDDDAIATLQETIDQTDDPESVRRRSLMTYPTQESVQDETLVADELGRPPAPRAAWPRRRRRRTAQ